MITLPHTDEATKIVLQDLISKKAVFKKSFQRMQLSLLVLFVAAGVVLINSYLTLSEQQETSYLEAFNLVVQDRLNYLMVIILIAVFAWVLVLRKQTDKLETEYYDFRREVIDKSSDYWQDEAWINRHIAFAIIQDEYDINLYYESK